MHSPLGGPNRMNGNMPGNPSQQSPHPQMGNVPPNMNLSGGNGSVSGPNMMSNNNNNGNNTPVSVNNNSPTTPMPPNNSSGGGGGGGVGNVNLSNMNTSNNTIPGSNNNNNGPNINIPTSNSNSNMNQNQMPPHPMGGPGGGPGMMNPGMNAGPNAMGGSMYGGPKPMPVSAGKVYPADTPMVFNPQNPNAPPIYPCGVCHKEVHDNDQGLLCESGCNFWFHR